MKMLIFLSSLLILSSLQAQESNSSRLPYRQIPAYPESYVAGNVLARMIDGLGYRFYWATEELREKDLAYKPSSDARTTLETIAHIHELSLAVANASQNLPNTRSDNATEPTFAELRQQTLENLQKASTFFQDKTAEELSELSVAFQRGDDVREFPLWHLMNGQLADALYHTGQVVAFRRASGNPQNPKVSVFSGKTRE